MKFTRTFFTCCFAILMIQLSAQTMAVTTPNASPKAYVGQQIGLTDIWISYHRPAVKDREIWGELVAYNQPWRAGANENTIMKFSDKVKIDGQELAGGKYGFHIIPIENEWTIILSNNHTSWGSYSYNPAEDALRVNATPTKAGHFEEFLTYYFEGMTPNSANCTLHWGDKKVSFVIETDVHEQVLAEMRNELRDKAGWTWVGWNEAANYCVKNNINHKEAMTWIQRSVFMSPTMQNMTTKGKLVAQMKGAEEDEAKNKVILTSIEGDLETQNVTWKEYHGAAKFATKIESYDHAEKWLNQSIAMSQNMTNLMDKSGMFAKKGEKDKAEKVKNEAIAKGTNQELNMYGYQLAWSGKTAEAVEIFKANCDKHKDDPNTWDSLGEGYFMNGDKEESIKAFRTCLSMNPPDGVKGNSIKYLTQMGVEIEEEAKP